MEKELPPKLACDEWRFTLKETKRPTHKLVCCIVGLHNLYRPSFKTNRKNKNRKNPITKERK